MALAIERSTGRQDNLAALVNSQGNPAEAALLYQRALSIFERAFGPGHPKVITSLTNYRRLLTKAGRKAEALELSARAARYPKSAKDVAS